MLSEDAATVHALRADLALQISRHYGRLGLSQSFAAGQLGIPQPTLSKIVNGRISNLSLELLIRIAVRAQLPLTLMTGRTALEAGAYISGTQPASGPRSGHSIAERARHAVRQTQRGLTPSQRLEAFLEHSQWLHELQRSARGAASARVGKAQRR